VNSGPEILRERWGRWSAPALKLLISACAAAMAALAGMGWVSVLGLLLLGGALSARDAVRPSRAWGVVGMVGGLLSLGIPLRVLFGADEAFAAHWQVFFCAAGAWLVTVSVLPWVPGRADTRPTLGSVTGLTVGLLAGGWWIGVAYLEALRMPFYLGILPMVGLLTLCTLHFRPPLLVAQAFNTGILVLVGIPAVDLVWRPPEPAPVPSVAARFYAYEAARRDPVTFERWWSFFTQHSNEMLAKVLQKDPRHLAPARTIPGARAMLFESEIAINSLGFRGPEVSRDKGEAYRIVALGESTTFGFTLRQEDRPWPEVLENLIRERAGLARPVEVINAGLPGFTLQDNLRRFPADIAPLEPDLILSYHGYNGFSFLDRALPLPTGQLPPTFRPRALRLLQQAEHRARVLWFRRQQEPLAAPVFDPRSVLDTDLANLYNQLGRLAQRHEARLAVATFSMAVNDRSENEVVEFYRLGFPAVRWNIQANRAHTELVQAFASARPEVVYVDSRPALDGKPDYFIDLVHLTQEGRNQIAEVFYAALEPILQAEVGR
jgi:lysophospholipase L1-like esterase